MSNAKALAAYSPLFADYLALKPEQLPVELTFPSERLARAFRLRWHGYRKAVERAVSKNDWEGEGDSELARNWKRSATYSMRLRTDPFAAGGPTTVVIEQRESDEVLTIMAMALIHAKPADVTTAVAAVVPTTQLEVEMGKHSDALAALGYGTSGAVAVTVPADQPEAIVPAQEK